MRDQWGRVINYLRISVTPACNLGCIYCAAPEGQPVTMKKLMTAAEIQVVTRVMAGLGIRKVRLTGGEPLCRPEIATIVSQVAGVPGISDLAMTTNGTMLAAALPDLVTAGLRRVNISLDSLRAERYADITAGGRLADVWEGIEAVLQAGLQPLRLNVVVIPGVNDDEIVDFVELARAAPVEVRFIELMPIGRFGMEHSGQTLSGAAILATFPELKPLATSTGPARYYSAAGFRGRVGLISALSHQFCESCNRIRLTADGRIKPCLGNNQEINLMPFFDQPGHLRQEIIKAIWAKPAGHRFGRGYQASRSMTATGG